MMTSLSPISVRFANRVREGDEGLTPPPPSGQDQVQIEAENVGFLSNPSMKIKNVGFEVA